MIRLAAYACTDDAWIEYDKLQPELPRADNSRMKRDHGGRPLRSARLRRASAGEQTGAPIRRMDGSLCGAVVSGKLSQVGYPSRTPSQAEPTAVDTIAAEL